MFGLFILSTIFFFYFSGICPLLCSGHGVYGGGECHCTDGWKGSECDVRASECLAADSGSNIIFRSFPIIHRVKFFTSIHHVTTINYFDYNKLFLIIFYFLSTIYFFLFQVFAHYFVVDTGCMEAVNVTVLTAGKDLNVTLEPVSV